MEKIDPKIVSYILNPDFAVAQFMSVCLTFGDEYAT